MNHALPKQMHAPAHTLAKLIPTASVGVVLLLSNTFLIVTLRSVFSFIHEHKEGFVNLVCL